MSLVSNEGDSEQNEMRSLQERLESTMSLVKQLSSQLAELKEQVGALQWVATGVGVGERASFHQITVRTALQKRLLSYEDVVFPSSKLSEQIRW